MATRIMIFDPFAGVSGDMILAATLDLGLSAEWLHDLVAGLPLEAKLKITKVRRGSLQATAVRVVAEGPSRRRSVTDLVEIVESAAVDPAVRDRAIRVIERLVDVEAGLHGMAREEVHLHELGGVDTIVDVVGCCAAVRELDVERCFTRPVAIGRGFVETEHGRLPLPAPATLRLLEGLDVRQTDLEGELTTPTGAALLAELTGGERLPSVFTPVRSGMGAGNRNPETHPNVLRVVLADLWSVATQLFLVQCDIDDMSPEYMPALQDGLYRSGALDVVVQPVGMKKGRSGLRIEALVPSDRRLEACRFLLEESTSLGVRFWPVDREVLPRSMQTIEWRGQTIRVKVGTTPEGHLRIKPEYDDVLRAARSMGLPVLQVREQIQRKLDRENLDDGLQQRSDTGR